ncbi:MAG TPA: asparagine synthase (glutamine-hydrolyzing) [Microvirga sp.]|nr:asparagine synthase (glutamine-hydrolyzing) [Microvirga sp.]
MCGILAVQVFEGSAPWELALKALDSLRHRGPDDAGLLGVGQDGRRVAIGEPARIILGHRRLSILDLSSAGHQPMVCRTTGNTLVFNGEIYNFLELRQQLQAEGASFRSDSDTEVILEAWRLWGEAAFARFNGMWAMVLYDAQSGDLVISRDRLGVKPLYFACDAASATFASEIRAVRIANRVEFRVNDGIAFDFLVGGMVDHEEETFFKGVVSIPAGALWRLRRSGNMVRRSYHSWPEPGEVAAADAGRLRDLIESAVALRLRSDAPTVSLLSGGLDSSIVTAIAARCGNLPRTRFEGAFTYGYRGDDAARFDETAQAERTLRSVAPDLRHTVVRVDPVPDSDTLRQVVAIQEQPFSTPSLIAHYRMYRAIREHGYKVVVNGEGSDELMAGYIRQYLNRLIRDLVRTLRFNRAVELLRSPHADIRLVLNRLAWDLPSAVLHPLLRTLRPNVGVLAGEFWRQNADRLDRVRSFYRQSVAERLRGDVLRTNLPQILRYADRNSMGHGVEVRSPFLDYRVIEYGFRVPLDAKLGAEGGKLLLRKAFAGIVPEEVRTRQKALGFGQAEQFNFLQAGRESFSNIPEEAGAFLDLGRLRRVVEGGTAHTNFWMPVCFVHWLAHVRAQGV